MSGKQPCEEEQNPGLISLGSDIFLHNTSLDIEMGIGMGMYNQDHEVQFHGVTGGDRAAVFDMDDVDPMNVHNYQQLSAGNDNIMGYVDLVAYDANIEPGFTIPNSRVETPVEPMRPLFASVTQAITEPIGDQLTNSIDASISSTRTTPLSILDSLQDISPTSSISTNMTPGTPTISTPTSTQGISVQSTLTPSTDFTPVYFGKGSFLSQQMSQNSDELTLGRKSTEPQDRDTWPCSASDANSEVGTAMLMAAIQILIDKDRLEVPRDILVVMRTSSPNPCFTTARENIVLTWLAENAPEVFLQISVNLLPPQFRSTRERVRTKLLADEILELASECSTAAIRLEMGK